MPFYHPSHDHWRGTTSRLLVFGPPNSGKTTSLLTWPRPAHIISFPGEKGHGTLLHDPDAGLHVYAYQADMPGGKRISTSQVLKEVRELTLEIITGKRGEVATLAGDGLHKLSDYMLDDATNGAFFAGDEFEPLLYVPARRALLDYLNLVTLSPVPHVAFTAWDALEKDKPRKEVKSYHTWPDLPGQLAKKVLGEFTATLFSKVVPGDKPQAPPKAVWQLKPDEEVWGVAVKCPPGVADKLPRYCAQDWGVLMGLLK